MHKKPRPAAWSGRFAEPVTERVQRYTASVSFVPALVITTSLMTRFRSRQDESYAARVLAALRQQFGGHAVKTE